MIVFDSIIEPHYKADCLLLPEAISRMFPYANSLFKCNQRCIFESIYGISVLVVSPQGVQYYLSILPFVFLPSPLLDVELIVYDPIGVNLTAPHVLALLLSCLLIVIFTLL